LGKKAAPFYSFIWRRERPQRKVFQMKKNRWVFMGALVLALIFGLALTACDNGSSGPSYISGVMAGTWAGNLGGAPVTLAIFGSSSAGNWTINGTGVHESGTYTMRGNTAILYSSESDAIPIGTAGLISSNTLQVTLNALTGGAAGTHTMTRTSL
jgi:hypothetical protein